MKISCCAILLWTLLSITTIMPEIDGANINAKMLSPRDFNEEKHLVNITRHYEGDIIFIKDVPVCDEVSCGETLGGSVTSYTEKRSSKEASSNCKCQCLKHLQTFREDKGFCVDTIEECKLIPFVSSVNALDTAEKIPAVFLPLNKGQIVYPSKELYFSDEYEKCVVVDANYMSTKSWVSIKTPLHTNDIPFRLFMDKNRTFLQWSGDASYRTILQGRLILLKLKCPNSLPSFQKLTLTNSDEDELPLKPIQNLSPCIAFRVTGSLLKHTTNITEVQFALEPSDKERDSLSTNEYVIIAITSFCLGLMYIATVFLYIYFKKKKDRANSVSSENSDKNFSRGDPDMINSRSSYRRTSTLSPSIEFMDNPEAHVIKSNPLMKHFMSFNENNGFISDSSDADSIIRSNDSPGTSDFGHDNLKNSLHLNQDPECLPEENVSITEESENRSENNQSFQNGTTRRKLYFNPAYFEPELLASPPPSAVEFLTKIREVITMAKSKMAAKRFQPMLNYIPEEGSYASGSEIYGPGTMNSRKSTLSSRRNGSTKDCAGCPGCESKKLSENPQSLKNCKSCGDKQKSIQKWLENVENASDSSSSSIYNEKKGDKKPLISLPILNEEHVGEESVHENYENNNDDDEDSLHAKSKSDDVQIVKGYVKEKKSLFVQRESVAARFKEQVSESNSIPKIISHSLKKNIKEMIYSQNFVRDKVSVFESKKTDTKLDSTAHEIYNNPKFNMDHEAEPSRAPYSSVLKKKQEVLDQYSNPVKRQIGNGINEATNLNQMPDMIYEAIEMEKKNKPSINYQSVPTPDYSSEYEMTKFKKYDNVSFAPFVPTPDYHTYGKNTLRNLKQYQPDSPIYSRKSPAYLVVDYETDSLERLNTFNKNRTPISTPTRSDFSSQPSPSALPMEEEVEIRNALYDREEGFRKDTDTIKKEREIDIQMRKTKIKYNTPNEGSMTIELEGVSPDENDEISSTDSDQFEPDTLDRHAKINKTVMEKIKMERKSFNSENIDKIERFEAASEFDEMGRILTLEVRHSKRQRNVGEASLKKLPSNEAPSAKPVNCIPPDVISSNLKPLKEESAQAFVKKPFENALRKTNKHILDEHDFKKSQISAPILTTIESTDITNGNSKKLNKTLRGDFLQMDLLNLDTNFHQNHFAQQYQPSLIKTIYHVEIPNPSAELTKEIFTENGKKTKDFKNAWKRFVGMASSKLKKYDNSEDENDGETNNDSRKIQSVTTTEIKQGKVKDIIKKLNVVHVDNCKLKEYDSGYLSAESINNDNSLTEVVTKAEIDKSPRNMKAIPSRPHVPPPPVPKMLNNFDRNAQHNKKPTAFNPLFNNRNNLYNLNNEDLVNINIYSSDDEDEDEQNSSARESEEDDIMCEDVGADSDFSFVN